MGGIAVVAAAAVLRGAVMMPAGDATAVTAAAAAAALVPRARVSLVLPVGLHAGSVATTVAVRSVSLLASRCCVPGSLCESEKAAERGHSESCESSIAN